ncbi:4-hydroxythreonine-4-phosphate dehydrogenase 2 [bacterium BMS3Abin14]|nr:4-hydroxythreonine-4-phosphate dehydrogenase 2 [bacterium BMS3Abin14]
MSRAAGKMPDPGPPLAITMGDPAGVGPEIIALAMEDEALRRRCIVLGNRDRLAAGARKAGSPTRYRLISDPEGAGSMKPDVPLLEVADVPRGLPFGRLNPAAGEAAYQCLIRAIDLALEGKVSGIVTAPLNKESLHQAGHPYPGHTEILAERTGSRDYVMMLAAGGMRALHVTTHIPISLVSRNISLERVLRVMHLGNDALVRMGIVKPRLAVAGLNPHAGEGGIFGDEETDILIPAVSAGLKEGFDVSGPIPPDVVFLRMYRGHYDAVITMYHDQGHIPLKLLAFESGVNVTLGLPIVRTSVDHGTAFDIAGKGLADPSSLVEAIRLAAGLVGRDIQ